jgi:hypothetical protein
MLTALSCNIAFTMWELMDFRYCQRLAADYSFEHVFEGDQVGNITSEHGHQAFERVVTGRLDAALIASGFPPLETAEHLTVSDIERAATLLGVRPSSFLRD